MAGTQAMPGIGQIAQQQPLRAGGAAASSSSTTSTTAAAARSPDSNPQSTATANSAASPNDGRFKIDQPSKQRTGGRKLIKCSIL